MKVVKRGWRRPLIVIMISVSLSACSTFEIVFDHLPFFTTWQMNRMFDLNDEQEQLAETGAIAMQAWMIGKGFPNIISRLSQAQIRWEAGDHLHAAQLIESGTQDTITEFLAALAPHLIPLMLSLDEGNLDHYREYNADRSKEWFAYAESEERKHESREQRLETWFGGLSREQRDQLKAHVPLLPDELRIRRDNNRRWVEQFLAAVMARDGEMLTVWLESPSIWWSDDYTALKAQNQLQMRAAVKMMLDTMSLEQSAHVIEEVEDWLETLSEIGA